MKAVLAFSGGMDSATLLYKLVTDGHEVIPVSFTYGSKHNPFEVGMAAKLLEHLHHHPPTGEGKLLTRKHFDLTAAMGGFKSNLMAGVGEVPEGHYEAKSMGQTVVPARNIIFASFLAGVAWDEGADTVALGVHAGDHAIYPDCRPQFVMAMNDAVYTGTDGRVELIAPFLKMTKAQILAQGLRLGVPYHLTRTCYKNQPVACGKCGSCQERLESFRLNNKEDPLEYESREIMPKGEK